LDKFWFPCFLPKLIVLPQASPASVGCQSLTEALKIWILIFGMVVWNTPWISMIRGLQKLWIFFQPTAPTFPARTLIGRLKCCHRGCYGPSPFPSLSFAIKVRAWKGKESNHQRHLSKVGIIFPFENNIILTTILFFYWCFNFQSNLASSVIVFIRNLSYLGDLLWLP